MIRSKFFLPKQERRGFSVLLYLSLALLTLSCITDEAQEDINSVLADPDSAGATNPPVVAPSCFNDRFVQPEAEVTKSIDLIFVVDTSGSLNEERTEVAQGIDSFVDALPDDVDFTVGVVLGHSPLSPWSGKFYQHAGEPVVLKSSDSTVEDIRAQLTLKLGNSVPGEAVSDGGEGTFVSLNQMMDSAPMALAKSQGSFRDNAALAVVFLSDEQELCYEYPEGENGVFDPQGTEIPFKANYCTRTNEEGEEETINHELILQKLVAAKKGKPLVVGAIAYADESNVPAGGENEFGRGYTDLAELAGSNGVLVDLASGNYESGLSQIGQLVTVNLQLVFFFGLSQPTEMLDLDTLEVAVDGIDAEFDYLDTTNQVHVPEPGISQSTVDISYCLKEDVDPCILNPLSCEIEV